MGLNKQKGNMYPWVTHTWNVIKGRCPHDCSYCYMKSYSQPELHFDEKELETNLGSGNFIFVGSSCDMWADSIDSLWINQILDHCKIYQNDYLFQSKNPRRFNDSLIHLPLASIIGTTIETNRHYKQIMGNAPAPESRIVAFIQNTSPKMVSIEPIMDFDLENLVSWMKAIKPEFISIGADSKGHNLPEPFGDKVLKLIEELKKITEVKIKTNLRRILRQEFPKDLSK